MVRWATGERSYRPRAPFRRYAHPVGTPVEDGGARVGGRRLGRRVRRQTERREIEDKKKKCSILMKQTVINLSRLLSALAKRVKFIYFCSLS